MDSSSIDLGEPVSPSSSSSRDSGEEEMEQSENSGRLEQSIESTSEGGETPGLTEMHESEQLDQERHERQELAVSSELREQNDEENTPKSPYVPDRKGEVSVSPQQSSVSEVSSENGEVQRNNTPGEEGHQDIEERLQESQWQLDQTRLGSPKEEHLDYDSSEGENDNVEKYDVGSGSPDINVTTDSSVWRKLTQETGKDEAESTSQNENESVSLKMNIHEKEVDDVSDQSGEESEEDEDADNNDDDQPVASSQGNGITNLPAVTAEKGEDLDDVSEQSDLEIEQAKTSDSDVREKVDVEDAGGHQEDLDDVSEQSDVDTGERGGLDPSAETSLTLDQEKETVQGQLEEPGNAELDDVSESEDGDGEDDGKQDQESLSGKSKETLDIETPTKEVHNSQEAVVDVDHHGDELDFEEDVEDRDAGEREEKAPQETRVTIGDEKDKADEDSKVERQDEKLRTEEELESGEEDEAAEDQQDEEAGELEDDDAEEGEVKDPDERKVTPRPVCRFFVRGQCTWGTACRFIHPGVNDLGNYSLIDFKEIEHNTAKLLNKDLNPPAPPPPEEVPEEEYLMPEPFLPPPPISAEPPRESVWERGIRQAKEMKKRAEQRKELGIPDEPKFVVEETYEDFDMEAEFNPDMNRIRAEPYGYPIEPSPEYHPRREQRGHYYEPRVSSRHEQRPKAPRPEPYHEPKYRENRTPRKDEFGRDFSKRQENFPERQQPPRSPPPKQYPPPKADRGFQERERKDERTRTNVVSSTPADAWQDPWARNRSPKPKSKQQSKSRKRSGSLSSGSSVSRSRSRSYSSGSSRSSSASSYSSKSDSRSPSPVSRKPKPTKPLGIQGRDRGLPPGRKPGAEAGKLGLRKPPGGPLEKTPPVKKLGLQPTPQKSSKPPRRSMSNSSISSASRSRSRSLSKSPPRSRPPPSVPAKAGTRPARRRRSSSGSSHVSVSSQSSADSDHMYANLASPVSSSSSPERQSRKKTKGTMKEREKLPFSSKNPRVNEPKSSRPKQMVTVPAMEAFREPPVQIKKTSKPVHQKATVDPKSKSTSAPAQMTSRNPVKHSAHKDIKLTLLNKPPAENKKRYEVLGEGATKKVKPVAPVKPTTKVVVEKERRPVKPLQQSTKKTTPSAMVAPVRTAAVKPNPSERKRPPSPFNQRDQPPAKVAHKTGTSRGGKVRDPAATKKTTISRREEILKQLKAVEEMIARKKAKMKN